LKVKIQENRGVIGTNYQKEEEKSLKLLSCGEEGLFWRSWPKFLENSHSWRQEVKRLVIYESMYKTINRAEENVQENSRT
jgi:hypothetical protein